MAVSSSMTLLLRDESGQDLIEYAAVGALIGLAALMSIHSLSNKIDNAFTSIGNGLTNAI
jgi:Flp pilus assembly pilin Flp